MRADRLIALVLLLQARGRMTAEDLAERLEVSVRTVYRDLDALSAAGVPVYAGRGPGGGVSLPDGYRVDLTALRPSEASALFLSATPGRLADLGVGAVLEGALRKLSAALPDATRREAEHARQRLHVDPTAWFGTDEPVPHLRTIQDGLSRDVRLVLDYKHRDGSPASRLVDPLGLVAKVSVWYLVVALPESEERRVFRVSRLRDVTVTDEPAHRPADFDLPTYWAEWCASFARTLDRYPVTLRAAPESLPELRRRFWRIGQSEISEDATALPLDPDGWVTLPPFDMEHVDYALETVLAAGSLVEVIAPEGLRRVVLEHVAALDRRYAAKTAQAAQSAEPAEPAELA